MKNEMREFEIVVTRKTGGRSFAGDVCWHVPFDYGR